jgi:hypothetical protein
MVDTPGFDDTDSQANDDEDILKQISDWMKKRFVVDYQLGHLG